MQIRKTKMSKTFIATGNLTLKNAIFYIDANDLDEAKAKFHTGRFSDWDTDEADPVSWLVDASTLEPVEITESGGQAA
jgi:hypothetical protein